MHSVQLFIIHIRYVRYSNTKPIKEIVIITTQLCIMPYACKRFRNPDSIKHSKIRHRIVICVCMRYEIKRNQIFLSAYANEDVTQSLSL